VPDSVLINGIGQLNCTQYDCEYSKFNVPIRSGTRLRIINTSGFAAIYFSLDDHKLHVIEVDGKDVFPRAVDMIRINPGQRYSVLVRCSSTPASYWMRASIDQDVLPSPSPNPDSLAIFTVGCFSDLPTSEPFPEPLIFTGNGQCKNDSSLCAFDYPTNLQPVPANEVPPATRTLPISIDFFADPVTGVNLPHLNGINFAPVTSTTFLELVRAGEQFPNNSNVNYISTGDVVDLIVNNHDTGEHPLHLHGHVMFVLGMAAAGSGDYNATNAVLDLTNPVIRDTASVNPNSWIYLRVVANNPGIWVFHCHIDWHITAGMLMVFAESPLHMRQRLGAIETPSACPSNSEL